MEHAVQKSDAAERRLDAMSELGRLRPVLLHRARPEDEKEKIIGGGR